MAFWSYGGKTLGADSAPPPPPAWIGLNLFWDTLYTYNYTKSQKSQKVSLAYYKLFSHSKVKT